MTRTVFALLFLPVLFACKDKDVATEADTDTDTDADTDTDTDADTDSDTDADTDSDTDTDTNAACQDEDAGALPVLITGSTVGETDDFFGSCEGTSGDYAVAFTAPADGEYVFDLGGSTFDTTLALFSDCAGSEIDCNDDSLGLVSMITYPMTANETVYAVIGGFGTGEGDFVLNIAEREANETDCGDERDLDADGLIDCADDDCEADLLCIETCDNGVDDNADFRTDCADEDCAADATCLDGCPELSVGTLVPTTLVGTTIGATSNDNGQCGGLDAPDITADFTAANDGRFVFELNPEGTDFDAILDVRSECSASTSLLCDDAIGMGGEQVIVDLLAADVVTVSIDGFNMEEGAFQLDVYEVPSTEESCLDGLDDDLDGLLDCLDDDCVADALCVQACPAQSVSGPLPTSVSGSTVGLADVIDSTCGASFPNSGTTFEFIAPSDADYAFGLDPFNSDFDSTLVLFDACGGAELACEDEIFVPGGEVALATLTAGQSVLVAVEGWGESGNFELDIVEVAPTETACDDGYDDDGDGLWDCVDDDCATAPSCMEVCTGLIDEDFDGLFDCADDDCAADPACTPVCPTELLSGALPIVVTGSTLGQPNGNTPSCGGLNASDVTYEFVAPAAGTYTFSTEGSAFDTVISALDACGGSELDCNDDSVGLTSALTVDLLLGESVVIVVDGFGTGSGDYTLTVSQ